MGKGIFITGTGTDVGKTFVTALLVKKLHESGKDAVYFKAAVSGNNRDANGRLIPGDPLHVKTVSGIPQPLGEMCPYIYERAVSPHLASRFEGDPISLERVVSQYHALRERHGLVTMEGSGGIICPLRHDDVRLMLEDVIAALRLPCLVVADAGLGTINAVVLTCAYMKSRGIPVKGVIFNRFHAGDAMEEDNRLMCEELTGIPVIACVADGATDIQLDADFLASLYE